MYFKVDALFLLNSMLTFLNIAEAPGVILADYNPAWREQRRFGLMTLRNFGLGKHTMEQRILGETQCIVKILEESVGKSTLQPVWPNVDIKHDIRI